MRVFFLAMFSAAALTAQQPSLRNPSLRFPPDIVPQEVRDGADALRADPKHYHLDFENDKIRVFRLTLRGDEVLPYSRRCAPGCGFYDAKDALLLCLKECHLGLEYPTKDKYDHTRIQDIDIEAGKSRWIFGNLRFVRNLTIEPLELLLIEPKVIESSK